MDAHRALMPAASRPRMLWLGSRFAMLPPLTSTVTMDRVTG
jgi:hypothetical protein